MGKNQMIMKKILFSIFCLMISSHTMAQTPSEQVRKRFEKALTNKTFRVPNSDIFFYNKPIKEEELKKIFEINKRYFEINKNFAEDVSSYMGTIYQISKNDSLRQDIIYFIEQGINDSIVQYAGNTILGVDLHIFDKRMKDEIIKNLNFSYKDLSSHRMLNENMILLAGALEMNEIKDRLQIIADSSSIYSNCKNAASVALCRMGDKRMLKEYFGKLESMQLQNVVSKYAEIEYIKQKECVDILLKILYSEETEPSPKETLPDDKLAWYAMMVIKRISTNCPIDVENIYSREQKDKCLAEMRRWAKTNKIKLNRETW